MVSKGGISKRKGRIFKRFLSRNLPCFFPREASPKKASKVVMDCQNHVAAHDGSEVVCKICRGPGVDESALYYPYACGGSIKHVHEDCLLRWLNHSQGVQGGGICKDGFKFTHAYTGNVYPKTALSKLSFRELVFGVASKAYRRNLVLNVYPLLFLWTVWLLDIPFPIPFMSASKALLVCVTFFGLGYQKILGWRIINPRILTVVLAKPVIFAFAQWVFPSFGYSISINSAVNLHSWIGSLALGVGWFTLKILIDLHNDIRDDLYMVDCGKSPYLYV